MANKLRFPPTTIQPGVDEIPVGFYMPWEKNLQPEIPSWWVEANGQLLSDPDSPLDGQYVPNINNVSKTKDVTFTSGSATATMDTTADIVAGALVVSASVPAGTKILSIDDATTVTLDQNATASGAASSTIGGNGPVFLGGSSTTGVWRADQFQGHLHGAHMRSSVTFTSGGGFIGGNTSGGTDVGLGLQGLYFENDSEGIPRTGDETYPKHHTVTYVMKIKDTGATKLITGYTLNGDEFGALTEVGSNIKATDRIAVYDPVGGIYKNVYISRAVAQGVQNLSGNTILTAGSPRINQVTTGATDVTITLPIGSTLIAGDKFEIDKVDSGAGKVTVSRAGSDTIDGVTSIDIDSQYDYAKLRWTGSFWKLLEYQDSFTVSGSNATFRGNRYADGTMVLAGSSSWSNGPTYTWGITFAVAPTVTLGPPNDQNARIGSVSTTGYRVLDTSASATGVQMIARGRWRA